MLKFALYTLFILAIGICASYCLFDAMSAEQEAREATLAHKIDTCKVGNYCKFNGQGFLKISGRK